MYNKNFLHTPTLHILNNCKNHEISTRIIEPLTTHFVKNLWPFYKSSLFLVIIILVDIYVTCGHKQYVSYKEEITNFGYHLSVWAGDSWHSSKIIHPRYRGWSSSNKKSPPMGLRADSFECDVTRLIRGLWIYFRNQIAQKKSFRWFLRFFHPHGWFYLSATNPQPSVCNRYYV